MSWMVDAACLDAPGLPWLTGADAVLLPELLAMTRICAACPVLAECAGYVSQASIVGGFWAGRHQGTPRQPVQAPLCDVAGPG